MSQDCTLKKASVGQIVLLGILAIMGGRENTINVAEEWQQKHYYISYACRKELDSL